MDITTITDLITNLGFPIALVIAMGIFIWKLYQQSVTREEKLMAVNSMAIETITKYADKLDAIQKDVAEIKNDVTTIMANK